MGRFDKNMKWMVIGRFAVSRYLIDSVGLSLYSRKTVKFLYTSTLNKCSVSVLKQQDHLSARPLSMCVCVFC